MSAISFGRLGQLLRKEMRQMLRDPRSRPLIFVAPVIQLLVLGYAVTTDVRHASTYLLDNDQSVESRQLASTLTATGYFDITQRGSRPAAMARALDRGDVLMAVQIPRGFGGDVERGRPTAVQLLVDGASANTATVALGYASQIIGRFGMERGADVAARMGTPVPAPGVDFQMRIWYNPNLESRTYNVPAVMGQIVMLMSLILTGLAVVREREIGTLEQLMVSPLKPIELMLGKTLPAALVAVIDLIIVAAVALLWFRVPFEGSFLLLAVGSVLFILTSLGIGLLISTVSNTQQEAFMTMFLFILPAMMLSGMMFPVENMPHLIQYLCRLNPIYQYLIVVRGVFLRGAGWGTLAPQLLVLAAMGVTVIAFATARFRKTTA
ncbi:MAG: ABC transporter permease [Gemmatimonadetes bacterium]|nr:ABC transporter permease [Gemmatimonadota bacterium]